MECSAAGDDDDDDDKGKDAWIRGSLGEIWEREEAEEIEGEVGAKGSWSERGFCACALLSECCLELPVVVVLSSHWLAHWLAHGPPRARLILAGSGWTRRPRKHASAVGAGWDTQTECFKWFKYQPAHSVIESKRSSTLGSALQSRSVLRRRRLG